MPVSVFALSRMAVEHKIQSWEIEGKDFHNIPVDVALESMIRKIGEHDGNVKVSMSEEKGEHYSSKIGSWEAPENSIKAYIHFDGCSLRSKKDSGFYLVHAGQGATDNRSEVELLKTLIKYLDNEIALYDARTSVAAKNLDVWNQDLRKLRSIAAMKAPQGRIKHSKPPHDHSFRRPL
jgi:hypothetical protein